MKSWHQKALEAAVSLLVAAFLLQWAWQLLRPLVPVLAIATGLIVLTLYILRRLRQW